MTDLELLSILKTLGATHDVALSEIANGQQTMMLALEKLFAVHSFSLAEIKRLRAKTNRLIRGYQDFDLDPETEDLIEEQEI